MKVKIIVLAVLVLLCVFFASCEKDKYEEEWEPPKENGQTQPETLNEPEPAKAGKMKTIDFIFAGYGTLGQPRNRQYIQAMLEALNEGIAEELNVQIGFTWAPYDSYEESVMEMVTADSGTDVVDIMYPGSDVYTALTNNNLLEDIKTDFRLLMPETYKLLYEKYAYLDEYLLTEGKQYYIPIVWANPVRHYVLTQKELYREYGQSIATLEDYELYMDWILANRPDLIPGYVYASEVIAAYMEGSGYYSGFATSFYRKMDDPLQTDTPMEQLSEFRNVYEMLARWHEKGFDTGIEDGNYAEPALSGQLASIVVYPSYYSRAETIHLPANMEYEYVVLYPDTTMVISPDFRGPSILTSADAGAEALRFFEFIYGNQEYYDLIQYGVEGVNYSKIGEKISTPSVAAWKTIMGWWGCDNFFNYKMERPTWSEPDDYASFFEKISFDNTVTGVQLYNRLGIEDPVVTDEDTLEEMTKFNAEVITPMLDYRFEVLRDFYEMLIEGNYSMTVDEAAQMLHEANADELIEAFEQYRSYVSKGN